MSVELTARLFDALETQAPFRLRVPVPLAGVDRVSIRTAPDGRRYLHLLLRATPQSVGTIVHAVRDTTAVLDESPGSIVATRPWVPMDFYFRLMFGDDAPAYVIYRCTPSLPAPEDVLAPGAALGTAGTELEIAFVEDGPGGLRYLDPAVWVRTLALFSDGFELLTDSFLELLLFGIAHDTVDSFGLTRFLSYMEDPTLPLHRRRILVDALRAEHEFRPRHGLAPDPTVEALYRLFLPSHGPGVSHATVVADYHTDVEADPDKFAYFYIGEMDLHFAAFRADHYEMDLIDIRAEGQAFSDLAASSGTYKAIVNSPLFGLGSCEKQFVAIRGARYLLACSANIAGLDYKGLAKGSLVFRGRTTEQSSCSISADPKTWRYHFSQSTTGQYGLHLNQIPATHDYASAVEPVIGVFRNGQRIGAGHEVDQMNTDGQTPRGEPDDPFKVRVPVTNGIPFVGRLQRLGVEYLFVLIRPDYYTDQPVMTPWEDLLQFLRELGVVDAFITDGDDSVGLIVAQRGMVVKPGCKKDGAMPLAIGFRRI